MIALGVLIALWWSQRRWRARGGTADDISAIAITQDEDMVTFFLRAMEKNIQLTNLN